MEATQQQQQSADEAGKPIEASQGGAIQLSQTKLQELQSKQGRLDALRGHGGSMKKKKKTAGAGADGVGDLVRCQCGWSEDEDDMVTGERRTAWAMSADTPRSIATSATRGSICTVTASRDRRTGAFRRCTRAIRACCRARSLKCSAS